MMSTSLKAVVLSLFLLNVCVSASPLSSRSPLDYAPKAAACPSTPLVRSAKGLSSGEAAYVSSRKANARRALRKWLKSTYPSLLSNSSKLPTLALSSSGGGYRAMLIGAGVHQALDDRETGVTSKLKGLYQSMTYESGLSGGAWLLSSIIGNDWPTISQIRTNLWYRTLPATPLLPNQLGVVLSDAEILASITAKDFAGYDPTAIDIYGRLVGYTLLEEKEGGVKQTLSSIRQQSNYQNHLYPFPIMTAIDAPAVQQCDAGINATQYEFTPVEFGSWDAERAAFIPTEYTGSIVGSDGSQACVKGYDNLNYVLGTSSNIFSQFCSAVPAAQTADLQYFYNYTEKLLGASNNSHRPALRDLYAPYPNTFSRQGKPAAVYPPKGRTAYDELYFIDGGFSGQVSPIWPFLYRDVDVLFAEDSNTETQTNGYPDGSDLHTTYIVAQSRGLTRMPFVPDNTTFVSRGYNTRPTFFGCDEPSAMMIVYLPNKDYVYASNTSTYKISYTKPEIDGMLANGQAVATYNGTAGFEQCVACALMKKTGNKKTKKCDACFKTYCATK